MMISNDTPAAVRRNRWRLGSRKGPFDRSRGRVPLLSRVTNR